jgi:hypothetical protein
MMKHVGDRRSRYTLLKHGLLLAAIILLASALAGCDSDTDAFTPPPATIIRATEPLMPPTRPSVSAPTGPTQAYPAPSYVIPTAPPISYPFPTLPISSFTPEAYPSN